MRARTPYIWGLIYLMPELKPTISIKIISQSGLIIVIYSALKSI